MKPLTKILIVIFSIIALIGIYFLIFNPFKSFQDKAFNDNPNYQIVLFGNDEITLYKGDEYEEPGFYALNNNTIVTDEVLIENTINSKEVGEYYIKYKIGDVVKVRNVKVIENPQNDQNDIEMEIIGNQKVEIMVGDTYLDSGCLAYDKNHNNISNKIKTDNQVDTSKSGTYYVIYTLNLDNVTKSLKREVVVSEKDLTTNDYLDIGVEYDKSFTNQSVNLIVSAAGNKFSHLILPNGDLVSSNIANYQVQENGVYYFYAYDKNNNYKMVSANVTNIDKTSPSASCVAEVKGDSTLITVTASDNSGIDSYLYQNTYEKVTPSYTIPQKVSNPMVTVKDKAGNTKTINCLVKKSYIEMHFIAGVSDDDAILIRTDDKVIMIDGGRYAARTKVVNYLKNLGITKIDAMIGSHVHWNHVQAQAAILDNFPVSNLYYSVDILNCVSKKQCESDDVRYIKSKIKEKGLTPQVIGVADKLEIGDMKLYFIGPVRGIFTTYQNANSLVFILEYGKNKYLFTGDTPSNYMNVTKFKNNASKFGLSLDIDVLKWPHHGYEDLTDALFKATTPKYAIIPNCCYCSTKYPSSTNKNLMKKYNTKYYQVCSGKNIVLTSDGENITIKTNQKASDYKR